MAKTLKMILKVPQGPPGAPLAENKLFWKRRAPVKSEVKISSEELPGRCTLRWDIYFSGKYLLCTGLRSVLSEYFPEKTKPSERRSANRDHPQRAKKQ